MQQVDQRDAREEPLDAMERPEGMAESPASVVSPQTELQEERPQRA